MWKENAKEIGRLSLEIEGSSLGRDLARRAPQGGGGFNRFAHSAGPNQKLSLQVYSIQVCSIQAYKYIGIQVYKRLVA